MSLQSPVKEGLTARVVKTKGLASPLEMRVFFFPSLSSIRVWVELIAQLYFVCFVRDRAIGGLTREKWAENGEIIFKGCKDMDLRSCRRLPQNSAVWESGVL